MRLFQDLDTNKLIRGFNYPEPVSFEGEQDMIGGIKRGDSTSFEYQVGRAYGTAEALATPLGIKFGAKLLGDNDGDYVVSNYNSDSELFTFTVSGTGSSSVYTLRPSWNTEKLNNLLGYDPEGFHETTKIRCVANIAGSLDQTGVKVYAAEGSLGIWFDSTLGAAGAPAWALACSRQIPISLSGNDTASDVAFALGETLDDDPAFSGATHIGSVVTTRDAVVGPRTAASVQGGGIFTLSVFIPGSLPNTLANVPYVDLAGEFEITAGDAVFSSADFTLRIHNDYHKGNEGVPTAATPIYPAPGLLKLLADTVGKILYVDAEYGDDLTAARETSKAYATLSAAIAASLAGDTIFVRPGTYELAASQSVGGRTLRGSGPQTVIGVAGTTDVFRITGDDTHFADIMVDGYIPFAFNSANGAITWNNLTMRGVSTRNGIDVITIGDNGEIHLDCFGCDFRSSYDLIVDNSGSHASTRVRCFNCNLDADSAGGISTTLGTIEILGGNLRGFAHSVAGGTLRILGAVLETVAAGTFCTVSSGTLAIANCRTVGSTNIAGLTMSGGTVTIAGTRLSTLTNAASNPITKSGGTLILEAGNVLVAHATRDSISAATAQNVKVFPGSCANKAVDADVTQQVSTLTVSTDVQ